MKQMMVPSPVVILAFTLTWQLLAASAIPKPLGANAVGPPVYGLTGEKKGHGLYGKRVDISSPRDISDGSKAVGPPFYGPNGEKGFGTYGQRKNGSSLSKIPDDPKPFNTPSFGFSGTRGRSSSGGRKKCSYRGRGYGRYWWGSHGGYGWRGHGKSFRKRGRPMV